MNEIRNPQISDLSIIVSEFFFPEFVDKGKSAIRSKDLDQIVGVVKKFSEALVGLF